jgi:hypothetical protein
MNKSVCEREDQTSEAARTGMVDCETSLHSQQCAICSDILLVHKILNDDSFFTDLEATTPPNAALIWRNARLRARKEALCVALRPIRYMKVLACIAFACSPCFRLLLPIGRQLTASWSGTLEPDLAFGLKLWPNMATESAIVLGAVGTVILMGLSSWYMLRHE